MLNVYNNQVTQSIYCSRGALYVGPTFQHGDKMNGLGQGGYPLVRTDVIYDINREVLDMPGIDMWHIRVDRGHDFE